MNINSFLYITSNDLTHCNFFITISFQTMIHGNLNYYMRHPLPSKIAISKIPHPRSCLHPLYLLQSGHRSYQQHLLSTHISRSPLHLFLFPPKTTAAIFPVFRTVPAIISLSIAHLHPMNKSITNHSRVNTKCFIKTLLQELRQQSRWTIMPIHQRTFAKHSPFATPTVPIRMPSRSSKIRKEFRHPSLISLTSPKLL